MEVVNLVVNTFYLANAPASCRYLAPLPTTARQSATAAHRAERISGDVRIGIVQCRGVSRF